MVQKLVTEAVAATTPSSVVNSLNATLAAINPSLVKSIDFVATFGAAANYVGSYSFLDDLSNTATKAGPQKILIASASGTDLIALKGTVNTALALLNPEKILGVKYVEYYTGAALNYACFWWSLATTAV